MRQPILSRKHLLLPLLRAAIVCSCALFLTHCAHKGPAAPLQTQAPQRPAVLPLSHYALQGPQYRQRDPRWATMPLGRSRHTIQSGGCTLCCVAMALSHLGVEADPPRLCEFLNQHNGFTASGDLIWASAAAYSGGTVKVAYIGAPKETLIDQSLRRGEPVIAKVYLSGRYQHWVLIVGKKDGEYLIRDPLSETGEVMQLSWVAPDIKAIRMFSRTPDKIALNQPAP